MPEVDLLGYGDAAEGALLATFREIMAVELDDSVSFDTKSRRIEASQEALEFGGSRLRTTASVPMPSDCQTNATWLAPHRCSWLAMQRYAMPKPVLWLGWPVPLPLNS
jgi:hypothetical protein